jgi:cell fate regulator YaaT (PSP1 superfamily)
MNKVVGIRFRPEGKIYEFDCGHFVLKKDDQVIVKTELGVSLGTVVTGPFKVDCRSASRELKQVFRLATPEDINQMERCLEIEKEGYKYCQECIQKLNLEMNLVKVEALFDLSKIIFFFTAEGRVDFRELVKELVQKFRTRIEMRQIGVRNQTKMVGGLGNCGRELCCSSFIKRFEPVSVKMAKEQNLSLNPAKISGLCGRLMCCLAYEYDQYVDAKKHLPRCGKMVNTKCGQGKIIRQNVLKTTVSVLTEDGREIEFRPDEVSCEDSGRKNKDSDG